MSETTVEFVERLARQFPALMPLLREHLADYDEVLPHLFFADLTRHVIAEWKRGRTDALRPILDELDAIYEGVIDDTDYRGEGEPLPNLIAVSFLENLPWRHEPGAEIREILGPHLRSELERMEAWRPEE
jgi:hypothetical protein